MGKQNPAQREKFEKLIYNNSNNTFNTYSKTCSSASKLFTKSVILELRRNTLNNNFYESKGKLKRDLSIETDICRLKRLCKKKIKMSVNRFATSEKSKYSINNTEIDTIEESIPDNSGCGDSEPNINEKNARFNIDLSVLVMENLKSLLNNWIKTYLLENKETKQKIETILDSILHKLEFQETVTSSSCTYTLDIVTVDQKGSKTGYTRTNEDKQQNSISHCTIPLSGRRLKLISTLSVPRNMQKLNRAMNAKSNKKIFISMKENSNCLNLSKMNIFNVSTKTLTKHCATYTKAKDQEYEDEEKWAGYLPKQSDSTLYFFKKRRAEKERYNYTETKTQYVDENNTPSFYKTICTDSACCNTLKEGDINEEIKTLNEGKLVSKDIRLDHCCSSILSSSMLDQNINNIKIKPYQAQSNSLVQIDFSNQNLKHCDNKSTYKLKNKNKIYSKYKKKCNHHMRLKKMREKRKCNFGNTKHAAYLLKNSEFSTLEENEFLNRFQTVIKYFAESEKGRDIKFDIHINMYPTGKYQSEDKDTTIDIQEKTVENCTHLCVSNLLHEQEDVKPQSLTKLVNSTNANPSQESHIISLLDGAASHAKYLMNKETFTNSCGRTKNISNVETNCIEMTNKIAKIDIAEEIGELRVIVKNLADTAEKFVNIHFSKTNDINNQTEKDLETSRIKISANKETKSVAVKPKYSQQSKGIQISNISRQSNFTSGVKLTKSPRNKQRNNLRLLKNSTSYRIIDSETILKVTDMTSTAGNATDKVKDEALTCSFPKTKSIYEVSSGSNKHELLAFYCDDLNKPDYIYSYSDHKFTVPSNQCQSKTPLIVETSYANRNRYNQSNYYEKSCGPVPCQSQKCPVYKDGFDMDTDDRVCIDFDGRYDKNVTVRRRAGVGYCKGCFCCILCWIPLFIIAWFFYVYVIKGILNPPKKSTIESIIESVKLNTSNLIHDLGF